MEDLLIDTLTYFSVPVIRQGSMNIDDDYPDRFFTFWNNGSASGSHYDNVATSTIWDFDVNFYSNDPSTMSATFDRAINELKRAGFIISGKGYDVASDETSHIGRGINVLYNQMN